MNANNLIDAGANVLNTVGNNTEMVKDVYGDAVKPAAQEIGKALVEPIKGVTRIGRLLNAICLPIDTWILNREYSLKETTKLLEKKLEEIPDEKLVTPPNYVFVPALQAISVSIDNEVLRDMYANLLAKSVYVETSAQAHPAYVDIIRQMSPIDAVIFKEINKNPKNQTAFPIKEFGIANKKDGSVIQSNAYLTNLDLYDVSIVSTSLSNLVRLGLYNKIDDHVFDISLYDDIDKNPEVVKFCDKETSEYIKDPINQYVVCEKGALFQTTFGTLFYNICCKDIDLGA